MTIFARKIERITGWINRKQEYFLNYPGYFSKFTNYQIGLENKKPNANLFALPFRS